MEYWDQLTPVLEGTLVRVEPLAAAHETALWAAASDPEVWRWMPLNAASSAEHFHGWLERMLEDGANGLLRCEFRDLGNTHDAAALANGEFAFIRIYAAVENGQQCGFARTIRPDQADAITIGNRE